MASLKKRGSTYYAQYYLNGRQKRVSLETDSLQIAKARLRSIEDRLESGAGDVRPSKTPIGEVVNRYIEHIQTTKTARSCRSDLFYFRAAFGPVCKALECVTEKSAAIQSIRPIQIQYIEDLSAAQVSEFLTHAARARGYSPKTLNRYREVLMRLVNWSMKQGGIRMPERRNPLTDVERYRENARTIRFLRTSDIEHQLTALADQPQLKTMVAVYIFAGVRREELLWLTRADFQMDAGKYGTIHIRAKRIGNESWQPKTRVNRAVPISEALHTYLRDYQAPIVPGHWYFPSPQGKRWDADNFSQRLREVNRALKLPWGCLDYRHTFGSHLAMKGESLYKIATLMGNSPEICRRHYATLLPESLQESVEFHPEGKKAL
jgi:integrase